MYNEGKKTEIATIPKRSNYYIAEPILERLRNLARRKDVSISEIVRRALEEYLKPEEMKTK